MWPLFFPVLDALETQLTFSVIAPLVRVGKVLVHCARGVSRSATLALAYLMIKERLTLVEAVEAVRRHRNILPNVGFLNQLCVLDSSLALQRKTTCGLINLWYKMFSSKEFWSLLNHMWGFTLQLIIFNTWLLTLEWLFPDNFHTVYLSITSDHHHHQITFKHGTVWSCLPPSFLPLSTTGLSWMFKYCKTKYQKYRNVCTILQLLYNRNKCWLDKHLLRVTPHR